MSDLNMPGEDDGVQGEFPPPDEQVAEEDRGAAGTGAPGDDPLGPGLALAPPD